MEPILKYTGAKWSLAEWIISHFPPHTHYLEPFMGSCSIYLNKKPAKHEVINDRNGHVVNLFKVLRTSTEERIGRSQAQRDFRPKMALKYNKLLYCTFLHGS